MSVSEVVTLRVGGLGSDVEQSNRALALNGGGIDRSNRFVLRNSLGKRCGRMSQLGHVCQPHGERLKPQVQRMIRMTIVAGLLQHGLGLGHGHGENSSFWAWALRHKRRDRGNVISLVSADRFGRLCCAYDNH